MTCSPSQSSVSKAIIPAAGLGTRMFPATKAIKKEMFPIVTPDGVCKPLIQNVVEEAVAAGATEIGIVVRPGDEDVFQEYFSATKPDYFERLPMAAQAEAEQLRRLSEMITYIHQDEQLGFGHAILCARQWVGEQPFLLLVGDHIYFSKASQPTAAQLTECFAEQNGKSVVSLYMAPGNDVHHYGTVCGKWLNEEKQVLTLENFIEKPSLEFARQHLAMPGLPNDNFLCVYGQYVLTADIFPILTENLAAKSDQQKELQLTPALEQLRQQSGMLGLVVDGEHYDTGQPFAYVDSLTDYANQLRLGL